MADIPGLQLRSGRFRSHPGPRAYLAAELPSMLAPLNQYRLPMRAEVAPFQED
jgi:hypothetical protein